MAGNNQIHIDIIADLQAGNVSGAAKKIEQAFSKMNSGKGLGENFSKIVSHMGAEVTDFVNTANSQFESKLDLSKFDKQGKDIVNTLKMLNRELDNLSLDEMYKLANIDTSGIQKIQQEIQKLENSLKGSVKDNIQGLTTGIEKLGSASKSKAVTELGTALRSLDVEKLVSSFNSAVTGLERFSTSGSEASTKMHALVASFTDGKISAKAFNEGLEEIKGSFTSNKAQTYIDGLKDLAPIMEKISTSTKGTTVQIEELTQKLNSDKFTLKAAAEQSVNDYRAAIEQMSNSVDSMRGRVKDATNDMFSFQGQVDQLKQRAKYFLSLENSVDLLRRTIREAIDTVKELDAAMTETAVVTDFDVGDMWNKLPEYTKMANELGVATLGVYEASTLYYQQGLETNQVTAMTAETLKMARIAGLEYEDATNLMTAALRGFNMELNEASAQRVNDIYSELAAITAADTNEIATAMTKTASIAKSANMEFETTAALLSQIIETTREPAETAGTAMKTIIARFTEMKESASDIVNVDGEEVNVNKVEEALRSAGVALRDVNGEFRDLDDVFLELSSKWNSLDVMTQRYVATMAAGSRQQSRFIAMMQDYDRTMELVDAAYSSAGASSVQFEKTQDSLESKLNRLSNAWDQFTMGIANSSIIKGSVDLITGLINIVNSVTHGFGDPISGGIMKITTAFVAMKAASKGIDTILVGFERKKQVASLQAQGKFDEADALRKTPLRSSNSSGGIKRFFTQAQPDTKQAIANNQKAVVSSAIAAKQAEESINDLAKANNLAAAAETRYGKSVAENTATQAQKATYLNATSNALYAARDAENAMLVAEDASTASAAAKAGVITALSQTYNLTDKELIEASSLAMLGVEGDKAVIAAKNGVASAIEAEILQRSRLNEEITEENLLKAQNISTDVADEIMGDKGINLNQKPLKKSGIDFFDKINQKLEGVNTRVTDFTANIGKSGSMTEKLGKGATNSFGKLGIGIKGVASQTGQLVKGLGKMISTAAKAHPAAAIAIAAIAAVGTIVAVVIHQINEQSALKVAQRRAEADKQALEETQAVLQATNEELTTLNEGWRNLTSATETLDTLTKGTLEWKQQLNEVNSQVQDLIGQYPELTEFLSVDSSTGEWKLDEKQYKQHLEDLENERASLQTKEVYQQAQSNYSDTKLKALQEASYTDAMWNMWFDNEETEGRYKEYMSDLYKEVTGESLGYNLTNEQIQQVLQSGEVRQAVLTDNVSKDQYKAAFNYFDEMTKAEKELNIAEQSAIASTLINEGITDEALIKATVNGFGESDITYSGLLDDYRDKHNFDLGTWLGMGYFGADINEGDDISMDTAAEQMGWKKVIGKDGLHWYEDAAGNVYNVNAWGKTKDTDKKITNSKGEEVTVKQLSDEEFLDRYDQQRAYEGTTEKTLAFAKELSKAENKELKKALSGDFTADISDYKNEIFVGDTNVTEQIRAFEQKRQKATQRYADQYGLDVENDYTKAQNINEFEQISVNFGEAAEELNAQYAKYLIIAQRLRQEAASLSDISNEEASAMEELAQASEKTAEKYKDFVKGIDTSSAINGAKQLSEAIAEGGMEAEFAQSVLETTSFYGFSSQLKELASTEDWANIENNLQAIYNSTGDLEASNIRELAKEHSDLSSIMETTGIKASAVAEMMEDVAQGELALTEITDELAEVYNNLYYSADLAGDAIARLESVQIGQTDTKLGNIYSESYGAVKDLMDRGAYGDSQIDDYMSQLIGEENWNEYLVGAKGNKKEAFQLANEEYGLSKNDGNLYGSTKYLLNQYGSVQAEDGKTILSVGTNGQVNYDLSGVKSTEEFIQKIATSFGVSNEYAETIVADMMTYSETLRSDLQKLDIANTLKEFLENNLRISNGETVLDITENEKKTFSQALGISVEDFEKRLKEAGIKGTVQREYSASNRWYSETSKDENGEETKTVSWDSDAVKNQIDERIKKIVENGTPIYKQNSSNQTNELLSNFAQAIQDGIAANTTISPVNVPVVITDTKGAEVSDDYIKELLAIDDIREIVLDPELDSDQKETMLNELNFGVDGATKTGIVSALLSEESVSAANQYSNYIGTQMYNNLGDAIATAMALFSEYKATVPWSFTVTEGDGLMGGLFNGSTMNGNFSLGGGQATFVNQSNESWGDSYDARKAKSDEILEEMLAGLSDSEAGSAYTNGNDSDNNPTKTGGSGGSGSEAENDTNSEKENINRKLAELERKLENNQIDAVEFKRQKDELLLGKNAAIDKQLRELEKEAEYLNKYYHYDKEAQAYLYDPTQYDGLSDEEKNNVDKELEQLNTLNDEVKEIHDELQDYEFRHEGNEEKYNEAYYNAQNQDAYLAQIERERGYLDRERELVGKLPEELQGPLNMALLGEDMMYEAQEIRYNRQKLDSLRQQRAVKEDEAFYIGDYYYYDEQSDSYLYDEKAMADEFLDKETRAAIEEEFNELQDILKEENATEDELYGGKVQQAIYGMAKASKTASKAFKEQDKAVEHVNDAFDDLEKKLGLSEDALDGFADKIGGAIEDSDLLKKEVKGLGVKDAQDKINNSLLGGLLSDDQKSALGQILGGGGTYGDLFGSMLGASGDMLTNIGDFMNFDMMSMGLDGMNMAMDMFEKGKQMVEQVIQYIAQAVQVVVDAWTNREDYLYNFLQIIEKHLIEYEKLQRYSTQIEKGRLTSSQDILKNWNEQWKSLQLQLEEQTERLETRQQELERSRWNPFSLISGWDPTSDTLYENRTSKFMWDLFIGFGSMLPMGLGSFFGSLNQLYEDYDKRVQNSYEDRLAAEQAILDIEDERLELVKVGSEEATEFEQKILDAVIQKEQEQIDELTRLNDLITDANSKLIQTLQDNLEKIRQDRENQKKEEELGEKERRLAYLRQNTSGANMLEIKKLEEQLEEEHEDYTDTLIDQKISELEKQNELAAEQRQQQIELLEGQLEYAEKYGLYWDAIYGMLYTIDENGNAILNPDNFDLDGNIRENSELAKLLGTFSDRMGMSVWSSVLDAEEAKRLGRYYGAFIGMNGVTGDWANAWALKDPGANDPNYAYPEQEIPDGLWGILYNLEIGMKKSFINNNLGIANSMGRIEESFKNFFGKLFGNDEWTNYEFEGYNAAHVQSTTFAGMKETSDSIKEWFASTFGQTSANAKSLSLNQGGTQNYGDQNVTNYFNIGTVGESVSLDDMVDKVTERLKGLFQTGNNSLQHGH